jgi:23S rRNA pseudouridine1911/1915/1917 synthase
VAKPIHIELGDGTRIPILYEDRSVIAIDKPEGWMLVPHSWQKTNRNLQAAIVSSMGAGHFWARSRNLKFLRYVHRLDAETTGILLFARSQGALESFGDLFESRRMDKKYLAVVQGLPERDDWTCTLKLAPDPSDFGRMRVDDRAGKDAETHFKVRQRGTDWTLVEAKPVTGRTHQIRVHLASAGLPVVDDPLYGPKPGRGARQSGRRAKPAGMGLRAVSLGYQDPFTKHRVLIEAPTDEFLRDFGFAVAPKPDQAAPAN